MTGIALYLIFSGAVANFAAVVVILDRLLGSSEADGGDETPTTADPSNEPRNAEKTAERRRETPAGYIYTISGDETPENWQKITYNGRRESGGAADETLEIL